MIANNSFKCIDLPYSEIFNSFVLKAFADHNSNAVQKIGFGIHKLKYCGMRRTYWFPAILYNSTLTLKAFLGCIDISEGLCLNIIWFSSLWKKNNLFLYECPISSFTLVLSLSPCHSVKTNWPNPSLFPNL